MTGLQQHWQPLATDEKCQNNHTEADVPRAAFMLSVKAAITLKLSKRTVFLFFR
jgi:hypothetical protein